MVFRHVIGRTDDQLVRAERFKMMAGGCQLIAIGVLAAAVVAPIFNPSLHPDFWTRVGGGAVASFMELLALRIMGYISPITAGPQAEPNAEKDR